MIKELRAAFPYHQVVKIVKAGTDRRVVYRIVNAGDPTYGVHPLHQKILFDLGWDWELAGRSIHVRKSN